MRSLRTSVAGLAGTAAIALTVLAMTTTPVFARTGGKNQSARQHGARRHGGRQHGGYHSRDGHQGGYHHFAQHRHKHGHKHHHGTHGNRFRNRGGGFASSRLAANEFTRTSFGGHTVGHFGRSHFSAGDGRHQHHRHKASVR